MLHSVFWTAVLSLAICAWASSPGNLVRPLVASEPATSRLAPGQVRDFGLPDGGAIRIDLDQGDADFSLEFFDKHWQATRTVDAFGWSKETATFEPGSAVRYLRVRRADHEKRSATFVVRLVRLPAFSTQDFARVRAEDATTSARILLRTVHNAAESRAAIAAARGAVELWRDAGGADADVRASLLLADALNSPAGDLAEAARIYSDTLSASRSSGDVRSEAESLNNRGVSFRRRSLFEEALNDFHESLQAWMRMVPLDGYASCLNNLALTEFELADFESSLRHFSESLRVETLVGVHDGDAFIFNNKALAEGVLGEWAASIQSLEHAAAIFESQKNNLAAGRALSNSALMYLRAGNAARAEANVRRGLALIDLAGDGHARAESLNLLGEVYTQTQRNGKALTVLTEALDLSRKLNDRKAEANALTTIGLTQTAMSDLAAAEDSFEGALVIFRTFGTPATQASVLYHLALTRRDLGHMDSALEAASEAVSIAENIRANVSVEKLKVAFLASTHDYYVALIDILMRQGLAVQAWQTAERARARALLEKVSTADLAHSPIPSLSEVQAWLGDGAALVEYSAGDVNGYVWVISKASFASFRLPSIREIEANADMVANLMTSRRASLSDAAFERATKNLATAMMLPATIADPSLQRLIIVPDGPLESIPFELLPGTPKSALIETYEVIESPSAAVALALTHRRAEHAGTGSGVLLIADPVFDARDARLGGHVSSTHEAVRFARLAFSRKEAQAITALQPDRPVTMMLDFDASKQSFTSGRLADVGILHISTHGLADPHDSSRSGLVLSLVGRDGSPRDGVLSAAEVSALRLNASVVVLSACDTAVGKQFAGEGSLSLARAFLYAGADRVIATRWQIDDEASESLLTAFYRSMWRDGLSPAAALRQAQLALLHDPRWRSPFYWASFALQGEP